MPKKTKKIILPVRVKKQAAKPISRKKLSVEARQAAEPKEKETVIAAGKKNAPAGKQAKKKNEQAPAYIDSEKIEREKKLIMRAGIAFFMILIISVWIFNIKNVFESTKAKMDDNAARTQLNEITDEFSKNMEQIKQGLEEIKSLEKNSSAQNEATGEDGAGEINSDDIKKLKEKLEELDDGITANEKQASSTDNAQNN